MGIAHGWVSSALPGYREHPRRHLTYSDFDFDALPPIERALDDEFEWLLAEPIVPKSESLDHVFIDGDPARFATGSGLDALLEGTRIELPAAFSNFVRSPEPRTRVRSSSGCYRDLADFAVSIGDSGWLIHFLSDQQWCGHWHLYGDIEGSEAVVWTGLPYGFEEHDGGPDWGPDFDPGVFAPGASESLVCASSFSEFLYRYWIEGEIVFAHSAPRRELTDEQRRYAEHYLKHDDGAAQAS